jgi:hypothetical protein
MDREANRARGRLKRRRQCLGCVLLLIVLAGLVDRYEARAADVRSDSAILANQSFGLLDKLSKAGSSANPLLGPVASFCGDAETLRQSLARGDLREADSQMISLQADRDAVDQALKVHPNPIALRDWTALRAQLDELAREIPSCGTNCDAARDAKPNHNVPSRAGTSSTGDSPRIVVASRDSDNGIVRLKGYFEGSDLKSAGIYEGQDELKAFNVDGVPGRQKVEFDLRLRSPSSATVLRIADSNNRMTEAFLIAPGGPTLSSAMSSKNSDLAARPPASREAGPPSEGAAIAEIPSYRALTPSPSKRHILDGNLASAKIDILAMTRTRNLPPTYQIIGQIAGRGITRAGIYLDGRLLEPIPVIAGASYTTFDRQIIADGGSPTVRAYGVGNRFVEQPLDLINAPDASELPDYQASGLVPAVPVPASEIGVQITAVQPLAGNLYVVAGTISGPDIAAAGLYQHGVLAQNIAVAGGLAGALGALIPGLARSINFSARFNPYAGPVSVRAFNTKGAYTEQPVVVAAALPFRAAPLHSPYTGPGSFPGGSGLPASPYNGMVGSAFPLR